MCFRKIYEKYPLMKGYLIIDNEFEKPWEFEEYDFNIPMINEIYLWRILPPVRLFKNGYIYLYNQINNNIFYSNNINIIWL